MQKPQNILVSCLMTDRLPWTEALRLYNADRRTRISQQVRSEFPLLSAAEQKAIVEERVRGKAPEPAPYDLAQRELEEKRRKLGLTGND